MTKTTATTSQRADYGSEISTFLGLGIVVLFFVASGLISYLNVRTLNIDALLVAKTHEVITGLEDLLSLMKDAETGQRGFLITGDEGYLDPHSAAVSGLTRRLNILETQLADNPVQLSQIPELRRQIDAKIRELAETIAVRRANGFDAARSIVSTDRGKATMDAIRTVIGQMEHDERALRAERIAEADRAYRTAILSGLLTGLLGVFLSLGIGMLTRRAVAQRRRQEWLQTGQIGLSEAMSGDQPLTLLGDKILKFLGEYLDAHGGALFVKDSGSFRRVATYGVPASGGVPETFELSDGLLGRAAKDRRTFIIRDVPDGYLKFGSAFGEGKPNHLIVAPATSEGMVNAVLELGFVHPISERATELLDRVAEFIGVAVQAAEYRSNLQNFLEETQRQAEELQAQSEELRVSNEELEEQSRALKESQSRLEQQQAELEQTNSQLEEQTQILEAQRDDLARAKQEVESKAREVAQASRYKSDFLANMSHELRTPLNSTLILAKLLADNPHQNLTEEQVRFAETIQAAGNDLLLLINDILDLSKIEAGRMEVRPEEVRIAPLIEELRRMFEPVASHKSIVLEVRAVDGCPDSIVTDRLRLDQVLRNLLSNAVKFTESGTVTFTVSGDGRESISFAVRDTGIGIPPHQRQMIFDAFRQADGTSNRKYGGTGLGLSISRELARLLGGDIVLVSEEGVGSTFTVTIPAAYDGSVHRARSAPPPQYESPVPMPVPIPEVAPKHALSAPARARAQVIDDRDRLTSDRRVILVVEDDGHFARIVLDLAHELKFNCLVATTAEEGIAMAIQYRPNAVVLDVGLPDHSGLSVLDRMKHDARTRHIPVHVVSAHDYAPTALALGAVGYMMKPVKREQLVEALERLELRLEQRLRRVLIVEDDAVQLDAIRRLLGAHDVETVGAQNAAECLQRLKDETFDCMVLDLTLPDASGYSLLETLSREDAYSFPPVIVYTGRELSDDEEQRLRRYSKSIIIKGAKSPERLLDEVTLFLHQVVSELPPERQRMLEKAKNRDAALEGRRILVVEDDVRNVFALTSMLEPRGAVIQIARNGFEALDALKQSSADGGAAIDLVLMDVMMPLMDGITAIREIRKIEQWKKLPIIALTAKAMKDDQEQCLTAGANDYMAKPLDVEKLLSLVRVWMPR